MGQLDDCYYYNYNKTLIKYKYVIYIIDDKEVGIYNN